MHIWPNNDTIGTLIKNAISDSSHLNPELVFQGSQNLNVRFAISQKGLAKFF